MIEKCWAIGGNVEGQCPTKSDSSQSNSSNSQSGNGSSKDSGKKDTKVLSFWLMNISPLLALVNLLMLSGLSILVLVLIFAWAAIGLFPIPLSTLHIPLSLAINKSFMQLAWVKLTLWFIMTWVITMQLSRMSFSVHTSVPISSQSTNSLILV